ncbi:MAG TPA: peptidylprolyl isomerase [Chthonomonadales bacterium]|nr:peptidylprolyl isomerase [Chthonomonadales bacterium]
MIGRTIAARRCLRFCLAVLSLSALAGCQSHMVVARILDEPVGDQEFYDRCQLVSSIPQNSGMTAGAIALIDIVRQRLEDKLAQEKGAVPSEDDVRRVAAWQVLSSPALKSALDKQQLPMSELLRSVRISLEEFGIGTEGAKADDKVVQDTFAAHIKDLTIPEFWTLKTLPVRDEPTAELLLTQLKKTGDFSAAALASGLPVQGAGQEQSVPPTSLTPVMRSALQNVPAGQFAEKPIEINAPNTSSGVPQKFYVLVQVVRKTPEHKPTLEEVRPIVEQIALQATHPEWQTHAEQETASFTHTALEQNKIQINIPMYKSLVRDYIVPQAEGRVATAPGGTLGPAQGTAPSHITPPGEAGGAAAPHSP